MKKFLLFVIAMFASGGLFAQIVLLNENMDSYAASSFLGNGNPTWFTTWSNLPGSGEDAQILTTYAHSGTKSASADMTGGQTDCVLKLGDRTTGTYELKWWMYVENGKCGYYNIQHMQAVGTEWAFEIYFRTNGDIHLQAGNIITNGTYPKATWFEVKHIIKLDADSIYLFINGSLLSKWPFHWQNSSTTGTNKLGAVDLFAGEESGSGEAPAFFFDDVSFSQLGTVVPTVVTSAASAVTSGGATLNGTVNANIQTTTVTFEYGTTTAYGTVVNGVPGSVTGTTVTPVSAAISSLQPGTTYHYRAKGVNSVGTATGADMTFTTAPALPGVTTTAATSVTSATATLNGSITAGGDATTVSFEYGPTTAYGTTVPGVPATVNGNTATTVSASIMGLTVNNTYHYRVIGVNSVGTVYGSDMTFFTTPCPMPGAAGTITGPANACGNSIGNVYTVPPITNATDYVWTLPAGASITSGNNTNSVTVTLGMTPGNVTVTGTNSCGTGGTAMLAVTVNPAPVPTITGPNHMCVNSGYFYYTTESGFSNYTWTINGGTINYGAGTNTVQVSWTSAGSHSISVNYSNLNGCMAGTPTVLNVTVDGVPSAAGQITGPATVCSGSTGSSYSVAAIPGTIAYVWTLPQGASIASGSGTNAITVDWNNVSGPQTITVYGNNLCGNGTTSPAYAVTVNPLPATPAAITGPASVCKGDAGVVYSVPAIANATGYVWTLPAGATIVGGPNTNSITVDFAADASSGNISVNGTNTCGNGPLSPNFALSANAVPPAPVITSAEYVLTSNASTGNQWYRNNEIITGATSQSFTATLSGEYWDVVTLSNCSSDPSNHIYIVIAGVNDLTKNNVTVYPNPNEGRFTVMIPAKTNEKFSINVISSTGSKILEIKDVEANRENEVNLGTVPPGIYSLLIGNSESSFVKKIIVK